MAKKFQKIFGNFFRRGLFFTVFETETKIRRHTTGQEQQLKAGGGALWSLSGTESEAKIDGFLMSK